MQNINNTISFGGSRQFLREADWVCRKVKSEFPMISPTHVYYSNPERILNNKNYMEFLMNKSLQLQEDRADRHFLKRGYKFLKEVLYSAAVHKVGNCSESVSLAEMIAKMNGVKNCYRLSFAEANPKKIMSVDSRNKLDHTVLMVSKNPVDQDGIKPSESLIIDPWLGISGRMRDIVTRYKNEFAKILKINKDTSLAFKLSEPLDLNEYDIEILRLGYPELIYKKKDKSAGFIRLA